MSVVGTLRGHMSSNMPQWKLVVDMQSFKLNSLSQFLSLLLLGLKTTQANGQNKIRVLCMQTYLLQLCDLELLLNILQRFINTCVFFIQDSNLHVRCFVFFFNKNVLYIINQIFFHSVYLKTKIIINFLKMQSIFLYCFHGKATSGLSGILTQQDMPACVIQAAFFGQMFLSVTQFNACKKF